MIKNWLKAATLGALVLFSGGILQAAVNDDIRTDSQQIAKWFSEEMGKMMAFQASALPLVNGAVHDILGFEVGLAGGLVTSDLDIARYKKLPLAALNNTGSEISLPKDVGIPSGVIYAKVGLPKGIDVGVKYGALDYDDTVSDAKSKYKSTVYGLEVRKKLLGGGLTGVALPDLALSLAYDNASGDVARTETYNAGLLGGQTLNAATTWKSEWNVGAVTARAVASKKILIVTPYAGLGYSQHTGDAETTITTVGTLAPGGAISETAKATGDADDGVLQALGGVEVAVFPLVHVNLGYLWSEDNWAAQAGLLVTFR
jgi:hypothetical protein